MIRIIEPLHYCAWCGELLIGEWLKDTRGREIHEGCIEDALDAAFSTRPAPIPPDVPETPEPDPLTLWSEPAPFTATEPDTETPEDPGAADTPADPEPETDAAPLRTCTKCGSEKPATHEFFFTAKPGRLMAQCKECKRRYYAAWEQRKKAGRAVPASLPEPMGETGADPEPNPPVSAPERGVQPSDAPSPSSIPSLPSHEPLTPKTCRARRMNVLMSEGDLDFRASLDTGTTASFERGIYPDPETVRRIDVALRTQEAKGETWPDSKRRSGLRGDTAPSLYKARSLGEFAH